MQHNHNLTQTQRRTLGNMCQTQRGSVLAITLMLLVVLALVGTFAIRNATQSERVMNGVRTSNVSEQAAETALRFCERLAQEHGQSGTFGGLTSATYIDDTITIAKASDGVWSNRATWNPNNARLLNLPAANYQTQVPNATNLTNAPQCIIERLNTGNATGFVITARGFGNDAVFNTDNSGAIISGAETWLQSTLTQTN